MKFHLFGYHFRFHDEGKPFILVLVALTLLFLLSGGISVGSVSCFFLLCCVSGFFRDPDRVPPKRDGLVVSAGDGIVTSIGKSVIPSSIETISGEAIRISVFLSFFDVHVNRSPIAGRVLETRYNKGRFVSAARDKDSLDNEQNVVLIESESGQKVVCVQIAGQVARRIVSDVGVGDFLATGERFGIIRFGSRVDVYVPVSASVCVEVGQRMVGGETVISILS